MGASEAEAEHRRSALIALHEIFEIEMHVSRLKIATLANFQSNVG
jgi:hypothetical protein